MTVATTMRPMSPAARAISMFLRGIFGHRVGKFRLPSASGPWTATASGKLKSKGWSEGGWYEYPGEIGPAAE